MSALDKQEGGKHYKDMKIQPIEYIVDNKLGWHEGNVVKYISRHGFKNGAEDVKKVIHYCELLLEKVYGIKPEKTFTESQGKEILRHAGAFIPVKQDVLVLKGFNHEQARSLIAKLDETKCFHTKLWKTSNGYNVEVFERDFLPELPTEAPDFKESCQ